MAITWGSVGNVPSRSYVCGHCGNAIASHVGYLGSIPEDRGAHHYFIYICHKCTNPTYFDNHLGQQIPGELFGSKVQHLPNNEVKALYDEARLCATVNAYTGSVLCSRKLLMNIAVSKGAKEGLSFLEYVTYLSDKGYVPPDGKEWVDHIRQKGNDATHEIALMKKDDAEDLITFVEALLRFIYEYPGMISSRKKG